MDKRLTALAAKIGAEIEEDASGLWAYAPKGFHFKASATATLCGGYVRGQFIGEARDDMLSELKDGIEECSLPDCEQAGHWGEEHPNA